MRNIYGPLHCRDDEELDEVNVAHMIDWALWHDSTDCAYCGRDGHRQEACPNRPKKRT